MEAPPVLELYDNLNFQRTFQAAYNAVSSGPIILYSAPLLQPITTLKDQFSGRGPELEKFTLQLVH